MLHIFTHTNARMRFRHDYGHQTIRGHTITLSVHTQTESLENVDTLLENTTNALCVFTSDMNDVKAFNRVLFTGHPRANTIAPLSKLSPLWTTYMFAIVVVWTVIEDESKSVCVQTKKSISVSFLGKKIKI